MRREAAVRMGDWKLLSFSSARGRPANRGEATVELYDLATDVGEATNVAYQEPARVATMKAKLAELLKGAVPFREPEGDAAE